MEVLRSEPNYVNQILSYGLSSEMVFLVCLINVLIGYIGACGYSLSEYDTYVRHGIPVIAIVGLYHQG